MNAPLSPEAMAKAGLCIGCGACAGLSRDASARMGWDAEGQLKPAGDPAWRTQPSLDFATLCPFSPHAANEDVIAAECFSHAAAVDPAIGRFHRAYVGHAEEGQYRERGSSGGMAGWVAEELLRRGLVDGVAHVAPVDPAEGALFRYRISRNVDALRSGAKSRYYPIELSAILREILAIPGRYAVVGIPCFIKAVHLARRQHPLLRERIVHTLGLVCGHMKSRHMVESFAWQMQTRIEDVQAVDFRVKDATRPANWYRAKLTHRDGATRAQDWWHLVDGDWGSGFFQNRACDWCDDVVAETADISFGDAWVEPYSSDGRGTNVVVVRSRAMLDLIEQGCAEGRVTLKPVDAAFVVETQAAGFRQRREGLAYRLSWRHGAIRPLKRVTPGHDLPIRRKLIYRGRHAIARGSVALFRAARRLRRPALFIGGGRAMLTVYQALTYSRGRLGRLFDWLGPAAR
ncbi:Coenzyme F420 hydrogenase/dehydrogenase, beta subunit C-terminal domain [Sphingobium olei]